MRTGSATIMMVLTSTACGRANFDPLDSGSGDSASAASCDLMAPFTTIAPIDELNNAFQAQGGPRLTSDELEVVFHSNRNAGGTAFELFYARRSDRSQPFSTPVAIAVAGPEVFFGAFSPDGRTLVYQVGQDAVGDIHVLTRPSRDMEFTSSSQPVAALTTGVAETAPLITADGAQLYYGRTDVALNIDIYVTDWPATSTGTQVTTLSGGTLETAPTPSADGTTIYYGQLNGDYELLVAHRASPSMPFSPPSVVAELETAAHDSPSWLSPDNCRLYFESTRDGADYQIFVAERTP